MSFNSSRRQGASTGVPGANSSHRTVHMSLERSGLSQNTPRNMDAVSPFPQYYNPMTRVQQRQSNPGPYSYPSQHEAFGSQIDYNLSWMPKDINLTDLLDQTAQPSLRFRRLEQSAKQVVSHRPVVEQPKDPNEFPLLPAEFEKWENQEKSNETVRKKRQEMLAKWFDETIKQELKDRTDKSEDTQMTSLLSKFTLENSEIKEK